MYGLNDQPASPAKKKPSTDLYAIAQSKYQSHGQAVQPDRSGSQFLRGVSSGVDSIQGAGYGLGSLAADAMGLDGARNRMLLGAIRNQREAEENAPRVNRIEDVHGLGDAADYVAGTLGQLAPNIASTVAGGGLGGMLAKQAGKYAAKGALKHVGATSARHVTAGQIAGGVSAGTGISTGTLYSETAQEGESGARAIIGSLLGGTASGLIDVMPVAGVARKFGLGKEFMDTVSRTAASNPLYKKLLQNKQKTSDTPIYKRIPKEAGKVGLQEAGTEVIQSLIEESTKAFIAERELPDNMVSILANSAVAGAIGGTAMGGAGGIPSQGNEQGFGLGQEAPSVLSPEEVVTDKPVATPDPHQGFGLDPNVKTAGSVDKVSTEQPFVLTGRDASKNAKQIRGDVAADSTSFSAETLKQANANLDQPNLSPGERLNKETGEIVQENPPQLIDRPSADSGLYDNYTIDELKQTLASVNARIEVKLGDGEDINLLTSERQKIRQKIQNTGQAAEVLENEKQVTAQKEEPAKQPQEAKSDEIQEVIDTPVSGTISNTGGVGNNPAHSLQPEENADAGTAIPERQQFPVVRAEETEEASEDPKGREPRPVQNEASTASRDPESRVDQQEIFSPTHELSNGTPVIAHEDDTDVWMDKLGGEYEENDVQRLTPKVGASVAKETAVQDNSNVLPSEKMGGKETSEVSPAEPDQGATDNLLTKKPKLIYKANGKPFATGKSAMASIKARKLDAEPVSIDGGFALKKKDSESRADQKRQTNTNAEPEGLGSDAKPETHQEASSPVLNKLRNKHKTLLSAYNSSTDKAKKSQLKRSLDKAASRLNKASRIDQGASYDQVALADRVKGLSAIDNAANEAATSPENNLPEPTQAQKEAGNYKVGKLKMHGFDISIENPKGSTRSGTDEKGNEWSQEMKHHYGYIKGTKAIDGDAVDVFLGPKAEEPDAKVFAVDQVDQNSRVFDEHKIMMGFDNKNEAVAAYKSNYEQGWNGDGAVTDLSLPEFQEWVAKGKHKKPFSDEVVVKQSSADNEASQIVSQPEATTRDNTEPTPAEKSTAKEGVIEAKKSSTMPIAVDAADINPQGAFNGTSFSPEKREQGWRDSYVSDMAAAWKSVEDKITDENRSEVEDVFRSLKEGYAKRLNDYFASHGSVQSAMITGPARFPTARNQKKGDWADKKMAAASDWLTKGNKRLAKALKGPVDNSPTGAIDQATKKLAGLETKQLRMKTVNAAHRNFLKNPSSLNKTDLSDTDKKLIREHKPEYSWESSPFATYQLKNNNAEIRRMKGRVEGLSERSALAEVQETDGAPEYKFDGGSVVLDHEQDRLQVLFDDKPDADMRAKLKKRGFRWSPKNTAWQRKITNAARSVAQEILGVDLDSRQDKPAFSRKKSAALVTPISAVELNAVINRISVGWKGGPDIKTISLVDLPAAIKLAAKDQKAPLDTIDGVFHDGTVYIVKDHIKSVRQAEEVIFHEVYGHYGVRKLFGPDVNQKLIKLYNAIGGRTGMKRLAKKYGIELSHYEAGAKNMTPDARNRLLMDELLSHIAQKETGKLRQKARELILAIRKWLHSHGFKRLAMWKADRIDAGITDILKRSREQVFGGDKKAQGGTMFHRAWHGNHTRGIASFSADNVGEGTTKQFEGWGLYFSDEQEIAELYREHTSFTKHGDDITKMGSIEYAYAGEGELRTDLQEDAKLRAAVKKDVPLVDMDAIIQDESRDTPFDEEAFFDQMFSSDPNTKTPAEVELEKIIDHYGFVDPLAREEMGHSKGGLYQVDLKPKQDEYLLWNKSLAAQSAKVKLALVRDIEAKRALKNIKEKGLTGEVLYKSLSELLGSEKSASLHLRSLGIRGNKYLDDAGIGDDIYNYVIFDDADVEIEARFSRRKEEDPFDDIDDEQSKEGLERAQELLKKSWDWAKDNTTEFVKNGGLQALTLDQVVDISKKVVPAAKSYADRLELMMTERNKMQEESGGLANLWQKLERKEKRRLSYVMNQSTLTGIDPTKKVFEASKVKIYGGMDAVRVALDEIVDSVDYKPQDVEVNGANLKLLAKRKMKAGRSLRSARGKDSLASARERLEKAEQDWRAMRNAIARDRKVEGSHSKVRKLYLALEPESRDVFEQAKKMYSARQSRTEMAIIASIERSLMADKKKKAVVTLIKQEFESARLNGIYFPLHRKGDYYVHTKRKRTDLASIDTYTKTPGRVFEVKTDGKIKFKTHRDDTLFDTPEEAIEWSKTWATADQAMASSNSRSDLVGLNLEAVEAPDGKGFVLQDNPYEKEFTMHSTDAEAKRYGASLDSSYKDTDVGKLEKSKNNSGPQVSGGFMADAINLMKSEAVDEKIQDELYQLYLNTLPELSQRKNFIHRKGVSGYSEDQLEAFGSNMTHKAHQISKMEAADDLAELQDSIAESAKHADQKDKLFAGQVRDRLKKQHDWVMSPSNASWTNWTSSFGFVMYLGASPAAALVNLSQTAIIGLPTLAAEIGWKKAGIELLRATKMLNIGETLMGEEAIKASELNSIDKRAFQVFEDSGKRNRSQAHMLAGIGDTDSLQNSQTYQKAMGRVGHLFHKAEIVNRDVTFLAAFRIAQQKFKEQTADQQALWASHKVQEIHFNYENYNRASVMQTDAAKLFMMFKSYSQHMIYYMMRNAHQWGKEGKEGKAAQTRLLGMLGITLAMGGVSALPIGIMGATAGGVYANAKYGTKKTLQGAAGIAALLAMAGLMWDDEDEPFDWGTEVRAFLRGMGGPNLEALVFRGAVNFATGINLSSRISLDSLLIRDSNRELEGKDLATHYIEQALGPVVGYAAGTATALKLWSDDHGYRAVERIMPVFAKNLMKAGRYANEGVLNLRGDSVVKKDLISVFGEDLNLWHVFVQAGGFSPEKIGGQYQKTNDIKGYEAQLQRRRKRIMSRYYLAYIQKDSNGMKEAIKAAQHWNQANPKARPINAKALRRSLKTRLRYRNDSVNGASVQKGYRYLVRELNAA